MAEPYTPTTESIRRDYAEHRKDCMHSPSYEQSRRFREGGNGEGEFDRWFLQEIERAEYSGYLRARAEARKEFADELTRKGVYLFNIHDIRRYVDD